MLFLVIMIDLHCHSYFSDGELSPVALMNKAVDSRLRILALTDHDTLAGLAPLQDAARHSGITIINGIELSVCWKKYYIHLLGLNINPEEAELIALVNAQNQGRIQRALNISACLKGAGIHDAYQKACDIAGHERVGRPHFAQVLINEGLVPDMKSAFKRFLGQGKSAYVPTVWVGIENAITAIVKASGQAVIAHPSKYALTRTKLHELIRTFKAAGGEGLEVVSGDITVADTMELAGLCTRFDLLASTGSDYHGDSLSRIGLGHQRPLPVNCTPIWDQWNI